MVDKANKSCLFIIYSLLAVLVRLCLVMGVPTEPLPTDPAVAVCRDPAPTLPAVKEPLPREPTEAPSPKAKSCRFW